MCAYHVGLIWLNDSLQILTYVKHLGYHKTLSNFVYVRVCGQEEGYSAAKTPDVTKVTENSEPYGQLKS